VEVDFRIIAAKTGVNLTVKTGLDRVDRAIVRLSVAGRFFAAHELG
jgi:hypothetical protein